MGSGCCGVLVCGGERDAALAVAPSAGDLCWGQAGARRQQCRGGVGGGAGTAAETWSTHKRQTPLCLLCVRLIAAHPCLRRYNTSLKTNKNKWFFQKLRF